MESEGLRIGEEEGRLVGEEDGSRIGDVEVLVGDLEGLPPDLRSPLRRRRMSRWQIWAQPRASLGCTAGGSSDRWRPKLTQSHSIMQLSITRWEGSSCISK